MSNVKRKADDIMGTSILFGPSSRLPNAIRLFQVEDYKNCKINIPPSPLRRKQWLGPGAKNNNLNKIII